MNPPRLAAALSACLALAACQREAAPPKPAEVPASPAVRVAAAPVTGTAVGTPSPPVSVASIPDAGLGEFRIVSLLLGNSLAGDKLVARDTDVFGRGDTLHASVLSTGANQGVRVSARWQGPDGAVIAETAQALVPTAATATTFTISNPQPWPPGEYQVVVGLNGKPALTRKFSVR